MLHKDLVQLKKNLAKFEPLLKEVKADGSVLIKKKQYIEICKNANSTLTFEELSKMLNINLDEVEEWILEAITAELIVARVDQISQTI